MKDLTMFLGLLGKGERGYTRRLNRLFAEAGHDVRREQFELLQVLWEGDGVNQQAIATRLGKDKFNVTKLLNTLENRGYVARRPGKDRRNNVVTLTGKGREAREGLEGVAWRLNADLSLSLPPAEVKAGAWVLKRLADALED
jgi:DNA-binding MarR family transcriptional regulator